MATDHDIRLFDLLEEAASWPEGERSARAAEACAAGDVSADELLAALDRAEQLDRFLDSPAWQQVAEHQPGDVAGRYRLVELLGEGGMGEVFLAEQDDPQRRVALKLVSSALVTPALVDRFRAEQQALARLNHPHVAALYDAGITSDGQPFFAMEWVDGRRIDQFFADRPPDLEDRLAVFLDVCSAVRHAHQKQIVHRDLKPSNVLVREVDGRPVAKVIDFGIAEALDRPADDAASDGDHVYGTPEYLSPESFDGDVDTRADVYSLGVLLYELLAGVRPFRRGDGSRDDQLRRILHGEAEPPSVAASRDDESSLLAMPSAAARRRWTRRLAGDLDAIVARAMHRDRDQRYDTVADLAADIERCLGFLPVTAREGGAFHRLGLLLRRRRGAVVATAVAVLSLVAGTVGLSVGMVRAQREAAATRAALHESEELVRFLSELFQESDPAQAQGDELTARELLDQGAKRLRDRLQDQPMARARLLRTIGDINAKLGYDEPAEELLVESLDLYRQHAGDDLPQVARAISGLAVMKTKAGELDAARDLFLQALEVLDRASAAEPQQRELVLYHLGVLAFRQVDHESAASYFDRACGGADPETAATDLAARCLEGYGALRVEQKRFDEAEPLYLRALELRESELGADHPHVAASLDSLCLLEGTRDRPAAAVSYCRRSYDIRRHTLGPGHPDTLASARRLGTYLRRTSRDEEAAATMLEAVTAWHEGGAAAAATSDAVSVWIRLAWLSWLGGEFEVAQSRYQRALEVAEEHGLGGTSSARVARLGLGLASWKQGRFGDAEHILRPLHEENLERGEQMAAWTAWGLAGVYRDRAASSQEVDSAGRLFEQALAIRRKSYPPGNELLELIEADYREYLERTAEAGRGNQT